MPPATPLSAATNAVSQSVGPGRPTLDHDPCHAAVATTTWLRTRNTPNVVADAERLPGTRLEPGEGCAVAARVAIHAHVAGARFCGARQDELGQLGSGSEVAGVDDVDPRLGTEAGEVVLHAIEEHARRHVP